MGMGDAESALALLNQKFPVADVIAGTKCERAIKWELTIGDDLTPHWNHSIVCVSIEKVPFAKGSCRTAHKLKDWSKPNLDLVGKFSTNKKTTRDSYFTDVLMQAFCAKWAEKFNELRPPKPITFLPTYVYELIDHPPPYPVCGGEPFIEGEYKKHNNNSGYQGQPAGAANAGGQQPNKSYDMAYFQSGNSNVPANLEDEERQLQEQLERIRAQQKAKQAAPKKEPSMSNLKLAAGKPMPQSIPPGKPQPQQHQPQQQLHPNSNQTTSASATPTQTSPNVASPQPVSPLASPKPAAVAVPAANKPAVAVASSASPVQQQQPAQQPIQQPPAARPVSATLQPVQSTPTSAQSTPVQQPAQPQQQPSPVQQPAVRASPPPQAATTGAATTNPEIVPDKSAFEKWDLKSIRNVDTVRGLQSECIIGVESRLFTGSNDGSIGVWDADQLKHVSNVRAHGKSIRAIGLTKTGNMITGGADSYLKEWDLNTMTCVKEVKEANEGHEGWVKSLYAHNNTLYSGSHDETVKVWDLKTTKCTATLKCKDRVETVYVTNQGIFAGAGDYLQVFDTASHENLSSTNTRSTDKLSSEP
ncbi:myosin heavy chain kinase [Heterostelium album PN500]|uniref:Myosin heavy chain kinase n=1 Tax=Heterostelium pallidum (strain ATCC 26659 / Pp 5 / PN500) TaxID=670386 RepID=D3AW24_HETP5|nr:myosin heavy chain kinase [Heterostelium album PN500]EFA86497.1 myosin heavy chain kinase [Heterostelium album PN500]|eukprot:XP_020438602.1 myosin heavy chain kinase [Heterostelium album PN500]